MILLKTILAEIKKIVNEAGDYKFLNKTHVFPHSSEETRATFGVVFSHKKGLTPEEGERIIKLFKKNDSNSDLTYYPATKKVVGKVGVFRFFMPGKVGSAQASLSPSLEKCRYKDDLNKIAKNIEIDKKTVHK